MTESASAQTAGFKAPGPAGSHWEVLAGYNTATHEGVDPYALDVWRMDAETGGTPVLAPMSGEIRYISDTCIGLQDDAVEFLLCHIFVDSGLDEGDDVVVGEVLGVVAPDGEAENNGIAHIHLQLNERDDEPWETGDPLPFAGQYAIEGVNFAATDEVNAHSGRGFISTNAEVDEPARATSVDAGPDVSATPGETVTLTSRTSGFSHLFWVQESGPSVTSDVATGASFTFVAPDQPGALLTFQLIANVNGSLLTDRVNVSIGAAPAEPAGESQQTVPEQPAPQSVPTGSIVSGSVFQGGISMIVFSGGTTEELIDAVGCALPELGIWASAPNGNLVQYTVGRPDFVNATWNSTFPNGMTGLTPLLLKCQ